MLQVFHMFCMFVANILSGCCKSRSGVAHVAIPVRSGGDASSLRAWSRGMATFGGRVKRRRGRGRACWREDGCGRRRNQRF
jgi:hypothetical protein